MCTKFWSHNMMKDHLGDLGIDRKIFNIILKVNCLKMWTGFF
jgi:hypothetical protein